MPRSFEDAAIDEAAEDPPLVPLAGAVLGVLLAGGGLCWFALSLFTSVPIPIGNPFIAVAIGVILFVISMLQWNPSV